jgi:hypothetical protein
MKIRMSAFVILAVLTVGTMRMAGQTGAPTPAQTTTRQGETLSVTGCIKPEPGDEQDFSVFASDGSVWDLESDSVKFDQHEGHTVTVTGKVESTSSDAGQRTGELAVDRLEMVSTSCSAPTSATAPTTSAPPARQDAAPTPASPTPERLPATASSLPLVALLGFVLLVIAFALRKMVRA